MVVAFNFLEISNDGNSKKYSYLRLNTGKRINAIHWDKKHGRPTQEFSLRDNLRLHHFLDEQEKLMSRSIQSLVESPFSIEITPKTVREAFLKKSGKVKTRIVKVSVPDDIEHFVRYGRLKELTLRNYRGLVHRLREYERFSGNPMVWHTFTQREFDGFLDYIDGMNYAENSKWGFQKRLVASFNRAKKNGLVPPSVFLEKRFKFETPNKPYLNWEQIALVLAFEPSTPMLKAAKTHFIVLAFSGVRYSDLERLYLNYEEGTAFNFSTFQLVKSPSPEVFLPALLPVKEQLKAGMPRMMSNPVLNVQLKALCAQVLPYEIAKEVTCHQLRRSFITNFLSLAVIPEHVIAMLTGHSLRRESRVFHSYNKISLFENTQVFIRLLTAVRPEQTAGIRLVEFVEQGLMN